MRERAMFGRRCLLVDDAIDDDRELGRWVGIALEHHRRTIGGHPA
jgi:hypothetical protein